MMWLLFWLFTFFVIRRIGILIIKLPLQSFELLQQSDKYLDEDTDTLNKWILNGCIQVFASRGSNSSNLKRYDDTKIIQDEHVLNQLNQQNQLNQLNQCNENKNENDDQECCFGDIFDGLNDQNNQIIISFNLMQLCQMVDYEKIQYKVDQYLCLTDKLNFRKMCKFFVSMYVVEIYPIDNEIMKRINEQILRQEKYKNLTSLIIQGYQGQGFDLNFLTELRMLNIQGSGGFQDSDINKLNLRGINISHSQNVTNLNCFQTLELLVACDNSGICDDSIKDSTQLEIVNVSNNNKITMIEHCEKIKALIARFDSGISDHSIQRMNLESLEALDVSYNPMVSLIGEKIFWKLRSLNCGGNCRIDNNSVKSLDLEKLDVSNNRMVSVINHMTKLKILIARGDSGISDESIKEMDLEELDITDNELVTDIRHMKKLKILRTKNLKLMEWFMRMKMKKIINQ